MIEFVLEILGFMFGVFYEPRDKEKGVEDLQAGADAAFYSHSRPGWGHGKVWVMQEKISWHGTGSGARNAQIVVVKK